MAKLAHAKKSSVSNSKREMSQKKPSIDHTDRENELFRPYQEKILNFKTLAIMAAGLVVILKFSGKYIQEIIRRTELAKSLCTMRLGLGP